MTERRPCGILKIHATQAAKEVTKLTIKDIAQRSGYAVGTVSRVLNGSPGVSEEARTKILSVLEETGFHPNRNARQLKQRERHGFIVIVKGTNNRLFAILVEKIQSLFREAGQSVSPYYVDEDGDEVEAAVQVSLSQKPLGIMFLGGNGSNFANRFSAITCPCVLVTTRADALGFENLSSVSTDDVAGAASAMGHLLDAGHRKIGIIGGNCALTAPFMTFNTSHLRLTGCQQAHLMRGLTFDPGRQTTDTRYSMQGGYDAANELLDRCPDLTALFAMSDIMAIGALRAIHDRGLRVPDDISLVGYDGIEQASYCIPRLTTVRQDADRLARRGVDILLQQTSGGRAVHEIVPFQLVEGESVRPISG